MTIEMPNAQLDWDDQGRPHSRVFDDVYFSDTAGLEETRYVFIEQNALKERFAALRANGQMVIGETGFGTGLNFLCAWQLFEQTAQPDARLHFISVEKYPLTRGDLHRALALWPQLSDVSEQLLAAYFAIHPGFQTLTLGNGRVTLTLLIGDVLEQLSQLDAQVDAWFLDGFAPAKNPDMWTPELFAQLARLAAPDATISTFTSTGWVRRALNEAGFKMRRTPGIGHKWEILRGTFLGVPEQALATSAVKPWYARPPQPTTERKALVIGGGLSGCASANSLARRGWQVVLLERHERLAKEASGNPQGVLYLKLSAHGTTLSQMIVSGFGYTRRLLEHLQRGRDWDDCGVLQLGFNAKEAQRHAQLAGAFAPALVHMLDQPQAQALAGIELAQGGLFYPEGGWVHPPALCQYQAMHPNVQVLTHHDVVQLNNVDNQWQACDGERVLASAPVVILAGAAEVKRFPASSGLPLKRIRGQITQLVQTEHSAALNTVVCAEGYVAPGRMGEHTLGASFDFDNDDLTTTPAGHQGNLDLMDEISPQLSSLFGEQLDPAQLQGWAAFRCTSPDYLPIVGPLSDPEAFASTYAVLRKDARQVPDTPCPWLHGLYVNSGHGSRGLITAPLSGEMLAAWINNEPLPVPRTIAEACHPNRFALRALIKGL
ncbi:MULTISPECIES: bifunctional tRNA (5-methylaminomethyl-2-thiouridine)(34)-methyltransferase MnmD/FAD-dependent 5-carboxymethylaminomethyl-2-thiouridine(34) oxidoreductase MnmC [unclassified Pseudomonas]|uniref:bifunctional tRNA (5-methylaminomethyl-2-thiouridine)(34)-methyltransferase MnmD/FAD-dependent 5-carboxymethylaminomethyl-2-thiouridine(34) oxidoreductase MnmC n=1 Tax=unclassified Pseudomonas TaxID=196821 RepID=UPI00075DA44D|nr:MULTISPECIES: bifunctional tRNA (5-methylaminomethyl-2-thiouridine)(34)-methyltransferase MnmD/FAD-dependent 5-carboxymethylaminomethyl-2-thiouridine(34) oxidoreductase MnmC [unclassified Pseudomonas]KVV02517.1 tRNA 5-methylaminomethyl-2-thiouridine biosynthesis bifunctional protein MnmC [Pseudomonas sp. TAD18]KVV04986.1 tRNA 5-methylaminomethyl-2-thiouridine biosynthesis bifunctional protein MnmC [Pseudomonas sp. TAA207]